MRYCAYKDHIEQENTLQDRFLEQIYGHAATRFLIRPFITPAFSKIAGQFLDSRASRFLIRPFIRLNHISLRECEKKTFSSFNDFFTRRLKKDSRPFSENPKHLISPCDARLTVYPITQTSTFRIKNTRYTLEQLLKNETLARHFEGGFLFLFRLSVDDYHRYIYVDDAIRSAERTIDGVLHTVNPAAAGQVPIYKENCREYSLLKSRHFGTLLQMEVGAMMVGKIVNHKKRCSGISVKRGQEKGYFAFGGSTILLLTQHDKVLPNSELLSLSARGIETKVLQGETIGKAFCL